MLNDKMQKVLNEHLNYEIYSSYLYLSMAAYFESIDLKGFANWMRIQVQEELVHVMKFYDYIIERDARVTLTEVAGPPTEWDSPAAAFADTLKHEQMVTERINKIVGAAITENDYATHTFLQWFITEQVEEEATAKGVLQQIKMIGESSDGLFMIDRELGQRVFTPPPAA
ncbi:MAG: ferritin [Thermodesulfobacteriota bacterium]